MKITEDIVAHVARLCRLHLSQDEHKKFTEQLNQILTYVENLNKLNTKNVEPTSHVVPLKNVLRKDEPLASMKPENVLANAPDKYKGYFKVPRIIE